MKIAGRVWIFAVVLIAGVVCAPMLKDSVWPKVQGFLNPEASEGSDAGKKQKALDSVVAEASSKKK